MKKLEIILDSDGILFDCVTATLNLYNNEYCDNLKFEDITDFNLSKFAKQGSDICKYFKQKGFFKNLPVIEGAQYYAKRLINDGHDIIIATDSPKNGIIDKIDAIEKQFPFIGFKNIFPTSRKEKLYGDILYDDGLHNILKTRCTYPVIQDYPWTRNLTGDYSVLKDVKRVYNWKEFYDFVYYISAKY